MNQSVTYLFFFSDPCSLGKDLLYEIQKRLISRRRRVDVKFSLDIRYEKDIEKLSKYVTKVSKCKFKVNQNHDLNNFFGDRNWHDRIFNEHGDKCNIFD